MDVALKTSATETSTASSAPYQHLTTKKLLEDQPTSIEPILARRRTERVEPIRRKRQSRVESLTPEAEQLRQKSQKRFQQHASVHVATILKLLTETELQIVSLVRVAESVRLQMAELREFRPIELRLVLRSHELSVDALEHLQTSDNKRPFGAMRLEHRRFHDLGEIGFALGREAAPY